MERKINHGWCRDSRPLDEGELSLDRARSWFILRKKIRTVVGSRVLGSFWLILDPIVLSAVYLFVFTVIRSNPSAQSLFIGISMYRIFSASIKSGVASVGDFSGGIKAERIRSRVIVSSAIMYRIFDNSMQSIGVAIILLVGFHVDLIGVVAFIIASQIMGITAEGLGLNLSLVVRRIPDLNNLISHFLLLMFFASPVLYPLSRAKGLHYTINEYNPFTYFVEFARYFADLESAFLYLDSGLSIILMSMVALLALRGYASIDRVRWEVSAWS